MTNSSTQCVTVVQSRCTKRLHSLWQLCRQHLLVCQVWFSLPSGFGPIVVTLPIHKCFQHHVRANSATERLWMPQTPSLIILSPPPSLPLPISAPFLSFSWGTWLMCTLPLVVFLIASTPAQSAQCTHTHTHTVSHQASVKNAHNRHAKIHTRHTHEQKEANTYMDTVYVLAHPAAHTHTHTHRRGSAAGAGACHFSTH